jgi:hypothetical protein
MTPRGHLLRQLEHSQELRRTMARAGVQAAMRTISRITGVCFTVMVHHSYPTVLLENPIGPHSAVLAVSNLRQDLW